MRQFLFEIKTRLGNDSLATIWNLLCLYISKFLKKDFADQKNSEKIDVVIPTTDKDFELLGLTIKSLKNIGNKINNIYIVSPTKEKIINFCKDNKLIFIDELKVLGWGKETLKSYTVNGIDRRGWLFQQFLKYGMKDIVSLDDYLVLDSDTILVNINTLKENGKYILFKNTEWHIPYFEAFKNIFEYKAENHTSFTSHMMIFNKKLLSEMLTEMEKKNNDKWYNVIQNKIDKKENSSISDYENYGQWMFINHKDKIIEKPLYNKALNRKLLLNSVGDLEKKYNRYKTVSFHNWTK